MDTLLSQHILDDIRRSLDALLKEHDRLLSEINRNKAEQSRLKQILDLAGSPVSTDASLFCSHCGKSDFKAKAGLGIHKATVHPEQWAIEKRMKRDKRDQLLEYLEEDSA